MKIMGEKIYLRTLDSSDTEDMLELYKRNAEFFQAFSPLRNEEFYTFEAQLNIIETNNMFMERGQKYSFGIFTKLNDKLIGNITLSEIIHGPLQSCNIGYALDKEHNGFGYMTEAVKLLVDFAFNTLTLHRIEAGVMPRNIASATVLEKAGFQREGVARKNVMINGRWEDHQVFAIVADRNY